MFGGVSIFLILIHLRQVISINIMIMIVRQLRKESRKLGRVNFRKGFWNCYYFGTSSLLVSIVANSQSRSQSSSAISDVTSPVKLVGKIR